MIFHEMFIHYLLQKVHLNFITRLKMDDNEAPTEPEPMSDYEKLRELNIHERQAELERMGFFKQLQDAKAKAAPPSSSEGSKPRKRPALSTITSSNINQEPRRSGRDRKAVSYNLDDYDDEDYKAPRQRRKKSSGKENQDPDFSPAEAELTEAAGTHSLRPRKDVSYQSQSVPHDHFIWCSDCNELKYDGCEVHVPMFQEFHNLNLTIEPSCAARNSGEGVVNRGELIKEGTLFGPYQGQYWTKDQYKEVIKAKQESGNAWEIRDDEGLNVVGYIDPGVSKDLNPKLHWMAKINCAARSSDQNLVGFQLHGQIYYRAIKDIHFGKELLVWYGNQYAKELGIDLTQLDYFKGEENHKSEGFTCGICHSVFSTSEALTAHHGQKNSCRKKLGKKAPTLFSCDKCPLTFSKYAELEGHNAVEHNPFKYGFKTAGTVCPHCCQNFSSRKNMLVHYKTYHEEKRDYKCSVCGKEFGYKTDLDKHYKAIHLKQRSYQCPDCEKSFARSSDLSKHRKSQHLGVRYPCDWEDCTYSATDKSNLKSHVITQHTGQYRHECEICLARGTWVGWAARDRYLTHKRRHHPEEWQQEQDKYQEDHPFVCKFSKCLKRFETEIEKTRHEAKLHS